MKYLGILFVFVLLAELTGFPAHPGSSEANEKLVTVDPPNHASFSMWLGKQVNTGPHFLPNGGVDYRAVVVSPTVPSRLWDKETMDIDLRVVHGADIVLPATKNGYTTLVNGEVSNIFTMTESWKGQFGVPAPPIEQQHPSLPTRNKVPIEAKSHYVLGVSNVQKAPRLHYTLNVRVTDGPLAGAIVHLRDHTRPTSGDDPFVAIYRIPDHLDVPDGELQFEVVRIEGK